MKNRWNLRDTVGRLEQPGITGEVDVLFPWHGFRLDADLPGRIELLKVFTRPGGGATPETLVETYQRGTDLVATYAQTPDRNVRPQVYWRAVEPASLEVVLSMQTSLLDSQPSTSVESALPAGDVVAIDKDCQPTETRFAAWQTDTNSPRAVLFRPTSLAVSYLEMVHPSDFAGVQFSMADGCSLVRWHLFPERLEKGVIRRARVRGVVLPRVDDLRLAGIAMADFAQSDLVLST